MRRYYRYRSWTSTHKHRRGYFKLVNEDDTARLAYNKDMAFRTFVYEWHADMPELLSWSLKDFYRAYKRKSYQLRINFGTDFAI